MENVTNTLRTDRPVFRGLTLVGGHPALDFLNSVKYRGAADPQDKLASISNVIDWGRIAGLLSEDDAKRLSRYSKATVGSVRVHREITEFREQVRILFDNNDRKRVRFNQAAVYVETAISALRPVATIDRQTVVLSRCVTVKTIGDLKARVVAAVADLLADRENLRIKTCGGFDCDWLFIDRTKAGRRQWCDTRTCGNVARVRRFRQKH